MKTFFVYSLFFGVLAMFLPMQECISQPTSEIKASYSLFDKTTPLEITLSLDIQRLLEDTSATTDYMSAILIEFTNQGKKSEYAVKVKAAGNTRLNENVCDFPPLRINFKKSELENTTFAGQDKLKLMTHCRETDDFENHVLLEYLAYKSYTTLTAFSYKVRLVNITYKDLSGKYPETTRIGFFVESDEQMAARVGGQISDKKIWSADSCNQKMVSLLTLFEFMIGNTDWWINTRHNVDIIQLQDGELIPVPFDFDYSGLVHTPYAIPSKLLPITEVSQRFLKGDCEEIDYYQDAMNTCLAKKSIILNLITGETHLDKRAQKTASNYIEDFFTVIESPGEFKNYIKTACDYFSNPNSHLK
ncbi:MAG: hypothetical protein U5K79_12225 [Cyclobacteriaceae bacterium]|nr:hypothetical protein [Cyclobacteriaceae bacterium]